MTPRLAGCALGLAGTLLLAGCSGGGASSSGGGGSGGATAAPAATSGASAAVTRWWSNGAARSGSAIDVAHPDAVAHRLHSSRTDYCGMLRETVQSGRSVLSGLTGQDEALAGATKAFLAELQGVAPEPVVSPWRVLASTIEALVAAGGDAKKVKGVDTADIQRAASVIAADAKSSCRLDLTAVAPS